MYHHCLHSAHVFCCTQHYLVSVRSEKVNRRFFWYKGTPLFFRMQTNLCHLVCCSSIRKVTVIFIPCRNIRPATQRAAQKYVGTHPGPLGCLSTSPRMVPARSSASATRVVPSCLIPMSCSLGERKLRVDSVPMMAQLCVKLTVCLASSGELWDKLRFAGGRGNSLRTARTWLYLHKSWFI